MNERRVYLQSQSMKERFRNICPRLLYDFLHKMKIVYLSFVDIFYYAPLFFHNNLIEQELFDSDYDVFEGVKNMKMQRKYDQIFPIIKKGMNILDVASGGGEAEAILRDRFGDGINYIGIDHDRNRIEKGKSIGHNVHLLDCSDYEELERFISENGPFDVICCIYAFYFFREPELFLKTIHGKTPTFILGCYNMGHWSYRLRMLFGGAPVPSPTHYYRQPQTNYAEMQRLWSKKDHEFIFRSLGYKYRIISVKSDLSSIHRKPNLFAFPGLTAKSFIYVLEPVSENGRKTSPEN